MKLFFHHFNILPKVTKRLILVITAVYIISLALPYGFFYTLGLVPKKVLSNFYIWQLVTYAFLHGSFFHLLINVFMLGLLGGVIEPILGGKKFFIYIMITLLGAAVFNVLLDYKLHIPIVGVSGAVFGLIAAFAVISPNAPVNLYFLFPMKAKHMAILLGVIEFAASFDISRSKIANLAHLGGLITGYVYLKWYPKLKRMIFKQ